MTDNTDFMKQAREQMDLWATEMKKLQDRMREAGVQGQDQLMRQWESLNEQRKEMEARMEEMSRAQMDAWKEVQKSMEKAWKDMEKSMEEARKKFMN